MVIVYLLGWWYGRGWAWVAKSWAGKLSAVGETFSVLILLRTLFSPWKQIQTPKTFRNFLQSSIDNMISRLVGATVRIFMLIGAFFASVFIIIFGLISFALWPLFPLALVVLPILFITGAGV